MAVPHNAVEEMPCRLLSRVRVGQDDGPYLVVTLQHSDRALEERIAEGGVSDIGRIVE